MAGNNDLEQRIRKALDELKKKPKGIQDDIKNPSIALRDIKIKFNTERDFKIKAVKKSFDLAILDVRPDKRLVTNDKKDPGSPQIKGQQEHREFAGLINGGDRTGKKGKVLRKLEKHYGFKFLQAEVDIWGWSVQKSKTTFYVGKMDAVAFRPEKSEVLIVDWKTSIQKGTESLFAWWDRAGNFGDPLYQTLVYRELLTKHLKRFIEVDIKIGVMLVPYHQSNDELLMPGLCVDFSQMETAGLLSGLKQYRWVSDESELVHTINFPGCKMFKKLEELNKLQCVDKETDLLKEGTLLKDVISDDAKIADLREEMGLLSLKVTTNVGEVQGEEDEDEDEVDEDSTHVQYSRPDSSGQNLESDGV